MIRVVLITPTTPHRGGIAHFGTLLAHHLGKHYQLVTWGFRRLYPAWLFPGSTAPDPSHHTVQCTVDTWIDALNPWSWWYAWRYMPGVDRIIWQWWSPFWIPFILFVTWQARRRRIPTIAICHQLVEPDAAEWQARIACWVLARADAVLFLGEAPSQWETPYRICALPSFDALIRDIPSKSEARQHLRINHDTPVVLCFGFVRDYKGIDTIIHAMAESRVAYHLIIAGEWWPLRIDMRRLVNTYAIAHRIHIYDHYIPNEQVATYFVAADVVVLPYRRGNVSGVASLAQVFGIPIITSNVGALSGNTPPYASLPSDDISAWRTTLDRFFTTPPQTTTAHTTGWDACLTALTSLVNESAL